MSIVRINQKYPIEVNEGDTIQDVLDMSASNGCTKPDEVYLNNCTVEYSTPLHEGDVLEIVFNDVEYPDQESDDSDNSPDDEPEEDTDDPTDDPDDET